MNFRTAAALAVVGTLTSTLATAGECRKTADGKAYATGIGNDNPNEKLAGAKRLGAERAAFLDALSNLKSCLGDQAQKVTGWSISAVRYYDADPLVEVDVSPSFESSHRVTVMGSANPTLDGTPAASDARIKATRAATIVAQRNAAEALKASFPSASSHGEIRKTHQSALGPCRTDEITYWDDMAVSVRLTCGVGVGAGAAPKPVAQPPVAKREVKTP